jgi:hypothetical protein
MILENQSADTFAGQFATEDPDHNDSHVYSLVEVAGNPNNPIFRIEGDTLYAMGYFDFESKAAHQIRVRSTDDEGLSKEQDFSVEVLDAFRPGVETLDPKQLNSASARLRGRILDNGGLAVLEQGFVVGLLPDPKPGQDGVNVFLVNSADSSGEFYHQVDDLSSGATYIVRAFARNSEGVTYGEQVRLILTDDGTPDIWADSTEIPGMPNWRESHWFGSFFQSSENWIYHSGLGWLYLTKQGTDGFWLWSDSLGWIWTGKGVFPYFYRNAENNWYLYLQNISGRTILFRYATREWVDL